MSLGLKKRAAQGELRNLTHNSREELHGWFREKDGTLSYREVARRLKEKFDLRVSTSSLSLYYNRAYPEIVGRKSTDGTAASVQTIVIRIEVPPGCRVDVSTEAPASAQGATEQ